MVEAFFGLPANCPYQKPHSRVFCSGRSFYDCPSPSDAAQIRLAIAFNDTNRANQRYVPVASVRRVVSVQAATRS
jgi:hypothetical protein